MQRHASSAWWTLDPVGIALRDTSRHGTPSPPRLPDTERSELQAHPSNSGIVKKCGIAGHHGIASHPTRLLACTSHLLPPRCRPCSHTCVAAQARTWALGAHIFAKWGLLARTWATNGRACMARRDASRYGTPAVQEIHVIRISITSLKSRRPPKRRNYEGRPCREFSR